MFRKIAQGFRLVWHFFLHTRPGQALLLLSVPAALVGIALWKPEYKPPIFDAQVHYNKESWQRVSVQAIINTADELNVPWLLVGSMPNEGTWRLHQYDPGRVIPMLVPYESREQRNNWFDDPKSTEFIEYQLEHWSYRGIGEFFLFDAQADTPVVQRMVELAVQRRLVLHARSDPAALERLFKLGPNLKILWAHAGVFTAPETVGQMLDRYPNLWIEISHRGDIAPDGKLSDKWRSLMMLYPDRFMLGSGTYSTEYWYQFRYALGRYRDWLNQLPATVAQRIAYRNGLELFDLKYEAKTGKEKDVIRFN